MKKYFYLSLAVLSVLISNPITFANVAEEIESQTAQNPPMAYSV